MLKNRTFESLSFGIIRFNIKKHFFFFGGGSISALKFVYWRLMLEYLLSKVTQRSAYHPVFDKTWRNQKKKILEKFPHWNGKFKLNAFIFRFVIKTEFESCFSSFFFINLFWMRSFWAFFGALTWKSFLCVCIYIYTYLHQYIYSIYIIHFALRSDNLEYNRCKSHRFSKASSISIDFFVDNYFSVDVSYWLVFSFNR